MEPITRAVTTAAVSMALAFGAVPPVTASAQVPGVQDAYQAWRLFRCYRTPALADGATFADTDAFECGLHGALRSRQDEPVEIVFDTTDSAFQAAATASQIRAPLPGRMERWARAVKQTGGNVYVCETGRSEPWAFILSLVLDGARWIMRQLQPSGRAFYAPALNRDIFIDYDQTGLPEVSRLKSITFQPRRASPEVPANCRASSQI